MNKKKLLAMLAKKNERKTALTKQAETCEDVAALRALNTEMDAINEEIRELQDLIDGLEDDDPDGRTAAVTSPVPGAVLAGAATRKAPDADEMEYRKAFMAYVLRGTPIPEELRDDAVTATTDIAHAIPSVLINRIVEKIESIGMILPLVTQTAFPAGMSIPTSAVKPVATWVSEGAGSERQNKTTSGAITFTHFKLRCEIAMTMEASVMAISAFETAFVRQVSEAMVKALETAIIRGAYSASAPTTLVGPKGILSETPATGQALAVKKLGYDVLTNAEAALPQAYENGARWCMTKKTFMCFAGMTDAEGQPIARVTYGIGGAPERTLLGRQVVLCGDYMDSFGATLENDKVFAFLFRFDDYTLNTNYNLGVSRKQDWDTEDMLTKAVMAVDGKVVDKNSLVTLKKSS